MNLFSIFIYNKTQGSTEIMFQNINTEEENTSSVKVGFEINIVEFRFINMKFYISRFFAFLYDAIIFGVFILISILYTSIALFEISNLYLI